MKQNQSINAVSPGKCAINSSYDVGELAEATMYQNSSDRGFTGHRSNDSGGNDLGLVYMGARFYVSGIGRFASADTIVPDPANPQSFNRFAYVLNSPINATDPSGHCPVGPDGERHCEEYQPVWGYPQIPEIQDWFATPDWMLLAFLMISEEPTKLLDSEKVIDAIGVAWVALNRLSTGGFGETLSDITLVGTQFALGDGLPFAQRRLNLLAHFDQEGGGSYFGNNVELAREAFWQAASLAKAILAGNISDPTAGALYFADAYKDENDREIRRERTAFWHVNNSRRDNPDDPHLTIPQIQALQIDSNQPSTIPRQWQNPKYWR